MAYVAVPFFPARDRLAPTIQDEGLMRLARLLLPLCLLSPVTAFALGLGDIRLHSALSQPLDAEIELLSVEESHLESLNAGLASFETYARMGVDRALVLSSLRFEVVKGRAGGHRIRVTSREPIREPFLDFLIEITWSSGRILREYTLLLDPPELMKEAAPRIAPAESTPVRSAQPVSGSPRTPRAGARAGASTTRQRPPSVYGPVRADETLWSIAKRMRPNRKVSVPQVMMALQKANPDAFEGNNINRLKEGYVLRLEDPALLTAMSRAEAAREMERQSRAWQDYKLQAAAEGGQRPGGRSAPEAVGTAAMASAEQPNLKLVTPKRDRKPSAGAKTDPVPGGEAATDMRKELLLAQEAFEAQKRDNEDLRNRLQQLETQLTSMQRLLSLKDEDLAALQRQLRGEAPEQASASGASAVEKAGDEATPPTVPSQESKPAVVAAAPTSKPQAGAAKPAPAKDQKAKMVPPPPPPADPLSGFVQDLLQNPTVVGALSIVGLSLVTLLGLIVRRRRRGSDFQESILTGGATSSMLSHKSDGAPEETSFLSDFAGTGLGDIQADDAEVDPLTEADVYMAYGRYQQAEDLLKEAMGQHPENKELLVKLLELYHTTKDKNAFEKRAADAFSILGAGALWDQVVAMGHELLPENPMFAVSSGVAAAVSSGGSKQPVLGDDVLDIGLDLDALTESVGAQAAPPDLAGSDSDLDLDLGLDLGDLGLDMPSTGKAAAPSADAGTGDALDDFDLGGLDLDGLASAQPEQGPASTAGAADDLDVGVFGLDEPASMQTEQSAAGLTANSADDFDLGAFGLDAPESAEPRAAIPTAAGSPADDFDLGLDLDLGGLSNEPPTPQTEAADLEPVDEEPLTDLGLDLGTLNDVVEEAGAAGPEAAEAPKGGESWDLDLDALIQNDLRGSEGGADEAGSAVPVQTVEAAEGDETAQSPDFDLGDLASFGAESVLEPQPGQPLPEEDAVDGEGLTFDLEDGEPSNDAFGLEWEAGSGEAPSGNDGAVDISDDADEEMAGLLAKADEMLGAQAGVETDFDLGDLKSDLDMLSPDIGTGATESVLDEDFGDDDLFADLDEVGTKLDLAKAYVDMGDGDSARGILDEVVRDGNEEQVRQAQQLLGQIA